MGGFRALTKHNNNNNNQNNARAQRKRTYQQAQQSANSQKTNQQPSLRLINLTTEQETTRDIPFVFEKLPTSKAEVETLLSSQLKTPEHALIGLQRIRDYYNPALVQAQEGSTSDAASQEDFNRFVHSLLVTWLDLERLELVEPVALHLKELSASPLTSVTIVAYLSSQMQSLAGLLQQLRDLEDEERDESTVFQQKNKMLPKFVKSLLRIQRIFIEILECPGSRLLDCLTSLSTQTYLTFQESLTEASNIESFTQLAENELKLMQALRKLNPTLISLGLKLANLTDNPQAVQLAEKIAHFNYDSFSNPQIVCAEISQAVSMGPSRAKRPRLEYLQMARQKPKGIPTYAPNIDPDFLIAGHFKKRQKTDEKVIKAKLKRADKETQRELKKDTMVLMQERQRQQDSKKRNTHSKVYRGGNMPKDEI